MKFNKKQIFLMLFLLIASNAITFKLTYDFLGMQTFLIYTELDAQKLKAYDQNDTKFLDIAINGSIDAVLYDVGKTGDAEKYSSLCQAFDKELFDIIEKYHTLNRDRYGDHSDDPELQDYQPNVEKGIATMKKLCHVSE